MDKATGKEVWSYDTKLDGGPFSFHGDPLVQGDMVLVPADLGCEAGYVYAFEKKTGKLQWKFPAGAPATSFVDAGDAVIVGTRRQAWMALSLDSGKPKWKFQEAMANAQCDIPKPAVTDGIRLAFISHDQFLYLLDIKSGSELRKIKLPSPASTGLFMYKDILYLGTADGRLRSINRESGQWLAEKNLSTTLTGLFTRAKTKLGTENVEYAFGFRMNEKRKNGVVLAFSDELEGARWSQDSEIEWSSEQPHLWKEWVVAGNCRGDMVAYRAADGAPAWKEHLQGCIRSFGDDATTLYVGVQEGTVYAYQR